MTRPNAVLRALHMVVALGLAVSAMACDPQADEAPPCDCSTEGLVLSLVDPLAWRAVTADDDPLADHRPALLVCPDSGWGEELGVLEVRTAECNYLSVEQPLAESIAVGDTLRLRVWWQSLVAEAPANGHLALLVDGELLWEIEVAIPGPSEAHEFEVISPIAAEAGAVVNFHLHNHGQNTWTLAELALMQRECCE